MTETRREIVPHLDWIDAKVRKAIQELQRDGTTGHEFKRGESLKQIVDDAKRQCAATISEALVILGVTR